MEERIVVEQKKQLYEAVDRMAKRLTGMADFIFDHPETDGNEVQAAACLLHSVGFTRTGPRESGARAGFPGSVSSASTTPWRTWDTAAATTCRDLPAWERPWR